MSIPGTCKALVARGSNEVRGRYKPAAELAGAVRGDPVSLLRSLVLPIVGHDQPISLKTL